MAIVACVVTVVILLVGGILYGLWKDRRDRAAEPCCAACRYPVRGLQALMCPECGIDLREAGILTPKLKIVRAPSLGERWGVWTLAIVFLGLLLTGIIGAMPGLHEIIATRRMVFTSPTGLFTQVIVESSARRRGKTYSDLSIKLTAVPATTTPSAPPAKLLVTPDRSVPWIAHTPDGKPREGKLPLTTADVNAWIVEADPSSKTLLQSPAGVAEIDDLFGAIKDLQTSPESTPIAYIKLVARSNTATITSGTARWFQIASGAFWTLTWLVGLYVLKYTHRRTKRRATSVPSPNPNTETATPAE